MSWSACIYSPAFQMLLYLYVLYLWIKNGFGCKTLLNPSYPPLPSCSPAVQWTLTVCFLLSLFLFFTSAPSLNPSSNFIHPETLSFTLPTLSLHPPLVLSMSSFLPPVLTLHLQFSPSSLSNHFSSFSPSQFFKPFHSSISPPPFLNSLCPWLPAVSCCW